MLELKGKEHSIDNQQRPWSLTNLKTLKATLYSFAKIITCDNEELGLI